VNQGPAHEDQTPKVGRGENGPSPANTVMPVEPGGLLERDVELGVLEDAVAQALGGHGSLIIVEGPAGIGKTSLLQAAGARARTRGTDVFAACGVPLERDFAFGVVRQLFEGPLTARPARGRSRLLAGAAKLAAPVVTGESPPTDAPIAESTVVHGLYWLTANFAERAPLLLVIDDLHWSDGPSLLYVAYLARRLEGLPVAVVAAARTGDPEVESSLVNELLATPGVQTLQIPALSEDGVARLVRDRLGRPDPEFVAACHEATGGVPFLVRELTQALAADGISPIAAESDAVRTSGPATVAHATVLRMARLSIDAVSVAEAVAVLDRHARADRIAAIAELDDPAVHDAREALCAMEILAHDRMPRFSHPLVRRAIYDGIAPAARAERHRSAAELLQAEGAAPEDVAIHLLASAPAGRPDTVEQLTQAAGRAVNGGAPASAVTYLARALEEGAAAPPAQQSELLHALARAELLTADTGALPHLEEAFALADDPRQRALIAYELGHVYSLVGDWEQIGVQFGIALAELGDRDADLATRIEAVRASSETYHPRTADAFEGRVPALRALLETDVPGTRNLALRMSAAMASRGFDLDEVVPFVERGLDEGRFVEDEGPEHQDLVQGMAALMGLDALDRVESEAAHAREVAQRRGSFFGVAVTSFFAAWVSGQRGALRAAEPDLRLATDIAVETGYQLVLPTLLFFPVEVLLERDGLADVAALAETTVLPPALAESASGWMLLAARGRLRSARGERQAAVDDLRTAGEMFTAMHFRNPILYAWRSPLALALTTGERDEATALAESEHADATHFGLPRAEGVALRTLGLLNDGQSGIDLLEESARVLAECPSPLERARTAVELGAALRRADHRVDAREHLRLGLDLAERCGAERLTARADEELRIAGARPRRRVVSGPGSLTASEERVARMAAEGLTNREVAEALYVTAKTVENQLSAAYRKLGVTSRRDLGGALTEEPPDLGGRPS
jgi:DNA-binding CsgD family transcriptional regulator